MNRRSIYLSAAVIFAVLSLAASIIFVSAQAPQEADTPAQPEVALGQPGTSFRYVKTFGVLETPYFSDLIHINRPLGLFIDGSNNLFVTEEQGLRLLKFNASGAGQIAIGKAGVCSTEDYGFCGINDAATDSSGNIWAADGNRVVRYSATGTFLQQFPEVDPWMSGSDNTRFNGVSGVALYDSEKLLYVSDRNNHRIQVFDLTTGSPVYSTTIGTAGIPGSGANQFNEPYRIAVDGSNRLIVADRTNNRVQRCTFSAGWTCTTLDSNLNRPQGVATDSGNNIYIADTENGLIRKCTSGGVCSDFVTNQNWLYDVAVDSSGRVYGSAAWNDIVVRFDSTGTPLGTFVGVEFVPYLTDGYHYNHPRIAIDRDGSILLIEELGQRLIKLDPNGSFLWSKGAPGVDMGGDNDHFSWPRGVAVDNNSNIYIADGWNNRVQIFNSNGVYQATLGSSNSGTGDYDFNWVSGIAVDNNGTIYVADGYNHRVQVYSSNRVYIATIGVTGVSGSDNSHFNEPQSIETDAARNIYVLDSRNCRVQKYNSNRIYQMTFGTTGNCDGLTNLGHPEDVTVDGQGRVYVSEWDNNAVKIYDVSGAFLTSIGGTWGINTSQFRGVSGVALDNSGNLFACDWQNARIQKFAPGVPGWKQVNINGFGDKNLQAGALEVFNGQLYASTTNWNDLNFIYRSSDGKTWNMVKDLGYRGIAVDMTVFDGQLYASTGWGEAVNTSARIYRTSDGTTWDEVVSNGFGSIENLTIDTLAVFQNKIYASTSKSDGDSGSVSIYRSDTGNAGTWSAVLTGGNGDANNHGVYAMIEFNGYLYAGVQNLTAGTRIWRTSNGTTWDQVNTLGFGDANNTETITLAVYKGSLYAGTINKTTGGQIWRTSNGTSWSPVMTNGFGDPNKSDINGFYVFENRLYATTTNGVTGTEVWSTSDGDQWSQVNIDGWGDSNNGFSLRGNAGANFKNNLFTSVMNGANGGEIWQMEKYKVHLPFMKR